MQNYSNVKKKDKWKELRERAEDSLEFFIRLVHPQRVMGSIHTELIDWWTRQDAKSHQLVLLPRDHQKSAMVGYRVAWEITKDPTLRVLYISSTSNLAVKQLKFIKDILTCDAYRMCWPEMVNKQEALREKWTETEISVDDPRRKKEAVRDPTIFTAGLTTTITGLHCDIAVLDDVVVQENAYLQEGRTKVEQQYSLLSSIEGADGREWVVGTRYHPNDLYGVIASRMVEEFDVEGNESGEHALYETFERKVEDRGDGTGQFLWPRQQRTDGHWFGYDIATLSKKRAQYLDRVQFRAQYYNDPNDYDNATITRDLFQYYDRTHLSRTDGHWYYKQNRLNVFAAVDFAFSLKRKADYTCIVVVGCDYANNYFVLDIERFKTDKISEYFEKILTLHKKWEFRKIRAEVNVAQDVIVKDLRTNYVQRHGLALSIDDHRPNKHQGSKQERTEATLQPRFANRQIWLYQGGNCQTLEEELVMVNPAHDDIKDTLAVVIESSIPPSKAFSKERSTLRMVGNSRFGGIL